MSVYRPSGSKVWWYEFMFSNQRIRESTKTRSKALALEAERQRRRELERAFARQLPVLARRPISGLTLKLQRACLVS